LIVALDVSAKITVDPTVTSNFLDYDGTFNALDTNLSGLVKNNHIFTCNGGDNELIMKIQERNLDEHEIIRHAAVRPSRGISNDIQKLREWSAALLQPIKPPGINPYKLVKLFFKYKPRGALPGL
jgi:hypothetical protein